MLIRYFQTLLFLDSRDQRGWTHWLGDVTTLWLDVYWGVDVLKHKWYISAGIQLSYLCCRLVASSIPIDHLRTNTAHHMNHTSLLLVWTRARFENITIEDKSSTWRHCEKLLIIDPMHLHARSTMLPHVCLLAAGIKLTTVPYMLGLRWPSCLYLCRHSWTGSFLPVKAATVCTPRTTSEWLDWN